MQIINVIEIINGNLSGIESFPITGSNTHDQQVQKAEELFLQKSKENSLTEIEDDDLLDDSYWSDNNGYEVMISWSNVNDTTLKYSLSEFETFKNGGRGYYEDGCEFYSPPGSTNFQAVSNGFLNTIRNSQ
jgi:hypothetical protein